MPNVAQIGSTLKAFMKNFKARRDYLKAHPEKLKPGQAVRHAIVAELGNVPGLASLVTVVNDFYEASDGVETGGAVAKRLDYAKLCLDIEGAPIPEIALALREIGVESKPTRQILASMLKTMGQMKAFKEDQRQGLDAILEHVIADRQESLWRHNEVVGFLLDLQKSGEVGQRGMEEIGAELRDQLRDIQTRLNGLATTVREGAMWALQENAAQEERNLEDRYLRQIEQEYGYLQLLGIPKGDDDSLLIDEAFVRLSVKEDGADSRTVEAESVLANEEELLIVGKAGCGKSTLLWWETVQCHRDPIDKTSGRFNRWHGMIPFFLRIRMFRPDEKLPDPGRWVDISTPKWSERNNGDVKKWTNKILESGRALLILDGLDEMDSGKRPDLWTELRRIVRDYRVAYRVSTRPTPSLEEKEDERSSNPPPGIKRVDVSDLSLDRIDALIEKWHRAFVVSCGSEERKKEEKKRIGSYPGPLKAKLRRQDFRQVRDLAKVPLLCAALCVTNKHKGQILEGRTTQFYSDVCEALLQVRDQRHEVRVDPDFDRLNAQDAFYIHGLVAYEMMTNRSFDTRESERLIEASRKAVLVWIEDCWGKISDAGIRARLKEGGKAEYEKFLTYLVERRALLREPGLDRIDFHHYALQEYLTASIMPQKEEIEALVDRADDDRWHNTIRLAGGGYYAKGETCQRIVRGLLNRGVRRSSRSSLLLAAANVKNLVPFDASLVTELLKAVKEHVLPCRNDAESHDLAAIGDDAIPLLTAESESENAEQKRWRALALLLIGSERALTALADRFGENVSSILDLFRYAPEVNSLTLPCVLRSLNDTGTLPGAARDYVYDLTPLEKTPSVESLDLSGCRNLTSLEPLAFLRNLSVLNLRGCANLTSLEPLEALKNLERVDLSYCPKDLDAAPLEKLKEAARTGDGKLRVVEWFDRPGVEMGFPPQPPACRETGDVYFQAIPAPAAESRTGVSPVASGRGILPVEDRRDACPTVGIPMVWVRGDTFKMGGTEYDSEKPVHEVSVGGFWMAKYPVTQAQYEAVMGKNPSGFKEGDTRNNPVETVSWNDAMEFCKKLSERTGRQFTLPTEAQWEYACWAGSAGRFCFGDSDDELGDYAWYDKNSEDKTHPVGQKKPNAWGLYDMHGNVWEWCLDHWHDNYSSAPKDGSAWLTDDANAFRVLRGGSWADNPMLCRSAIRYRINPTSSRNDYGFRVVCVSRTR